VLLKPGICQLCNFWHVVVKSSTNMPALTWLLSPAWHLRAAGTRCRRRTVTRWTCPCTSGSGNPSMRAAPPTPCFSASPCSSQCPSTTCWPTPSTTRSWRGSGEWARLPVVVLVVIASVYCFCFVLYFICIFFFTLIDPWNYLTISTCWLIWTIPIIHLLSKQNLWLFDHFKSRPLLTSSRLSCQV